MSETINCPKCGDRIFGKRDCGGCGWRRSTPAGAEDLERLVENYGASEREVIRCGRCGNLSLYAADTACVSRDAAKSALLAAIRALTEQLDEVREQSADLRLQLWRAEKTLEQERERALRRVCPYAEHEGRAEWLGVHLTALRGKGEGE